MKVIKLIIVYKEHNEVSNRFLKITNEINKERSDLILSKLNYNKYYPLCYNFRLYNIPFILISYDNIIRDRIDNPDLTKEKLVFLIDFVKNRLSDFKE